MYDGYWGKIQTVWIEINKQWKMHMRSMHNGQRGILPCLQQWGLAEKECHTDSRFSATRQRHQHCKMVCMLFSLHTRWWFSPYSYLNIKLDIHDLLSYCIISKWKISVVVNHRYPSLERGQLQGNHVHSGTWNIKTINTWTHTRV